MRNLKSRKRPLSFSVSLVVPIYNNEKILRSNCRLLIDFLSERFKSYELLFVDDGSSDGSRDILLNVAAKNPNVRVLWHNNNRGQQQAIATGMLAIVNEIGISIDADLPCALTSLEKVAGIAQNGVELVLGKRLFQISRSWWRRLGSHLANRLFKILFPFEIEDSGCSTAAVRRSLIEKFRSVNARVLLIKPQLLFLADTYEETEIQPPHLFISEKSTYSFFALVKLFWLMLLCRFQMMKPEKNKPQT